MSAAQIELELAIIQFKQELTIDEGGVARASVRAVARLAGVEYVSLFEHLHPKDSEPSYLVEKLFRRGYSERDIDSWCNEGIIDCAISAIVDFYAYEAGSECTWQARTMAQTFFSCGLELYKNTLRSLDPSVVGSLPTDEREFIQAVLDIALNSRMADEY